tara:strand:+ start:22777 stop:24153 length:1377 start_codon:yes stop_codon:yes gene_type:complete
MIITVGTLKSKISTDNPELLRALTKLYSFKIPGSEYSPQYRARRWDGKKHFISRDGSFMSGLLPRILSDLKKIECVPNIKYIEESEEKSIKDYGIDGFTYYDYQESLINKALSKKRGVIKSPTGSGKTLIMAGLVKALEGRKMLLLFNAKQLITQTYDFLTDTCGIENVGICYGEGYQYGDIMLSTVQSIEKVLDTHGKEVEVLMVDECHEFCNGKITLPAIQAFPNATYRFGFTATPPSDNIPEYNLEGALGSIIEEVDTAELVEKGKLTKPIIQIIERTYFSSGIDESMTYDEVYDTYIVNNVQRNNIIQEIINDIKGKQERPRILILTKSLDHGRILEQMLRPIVWCRFLEGDNSIGERYESISRFRQHPEASVLIGTRILQTGINIEEITHLINARSLKGKIATIQALGRALRKHNTKEHAYIYDFLDKEKYLYKHSKDRIKHYKQEGHSVTIL